MENLIPVVELISYVEFYRVPVTCEAGWIQTPGVESVASGISSKKDQAGIPFLTIVVSRILVQGLLKGTLFSEAPMPV